jgi:hypothetical protein
VGSYGQKPIILQIIMTIWRCIGHTLRKGDEFNKKQALGRQQDRSTRSKHGKGRFWREKVNAAKHGAKLRRGGNKSQMETLHKYPTCLTERKDILTNELTD